MVQFNRVLSPNASTNASPNASPNPSLQKTIHSAVGAQAIELRELQLSVEVTVDRSIGWLACPPQVEATLLQLLRDAIARSPRGGELTISACRTLRGIEFEIADSAPAADNDRHNAFSRCAPARYISQAALMPSSDNHGHCELYRTRCPQGGQAWTLVFISRQRLARTA